MAGTFRARRNRNVLVQFWAGSATAWTGAEPRFCGTRRCELLLIRERNAESKYRMKPKEEPRLAGAFTVFVLIGTDEESLCRRSL